MQSESLRVVWKWSGLRQEMSQVVVLTASLLWVSPWVKVIIIVLPEVSYAHSVLLSDAPPIPPFSGCQLSPEVSVFLSQAQCCVNMSEEKRLVHRRWNVSLNLSSLRSLVQSWGGTERHSGSVCRWMTACCSGHPQSLAHCWAAWREERRKSETSTWVGWKCFSENDKNVFS